MIDLSRIFSIRESLPGQQGGSKSMPPASKERPAAGSQIMGMAQQQAPAGTRVTGDAATLGALENILSDVRDESLMDWADEARDAIGAAIRKGGDTITATLPKYTGAPADEDEGDLE